MDWKDELYKYIATLDNNGYMQSYVEYVAMRSGIEEAQQKAYFDFRLPLLCVYVACSKLKLEFPVFECLPEGRKEEMFEWIRHKASYRKNWYEEIRHLQMLAVADGFFMQESGKFYQERETIFLSLERCLTK